MLGESIMNALADLQRKRIDRVVRERYDRYQSIGRRHAKRPRRQASVPSPKASDGQGRLVRVG